VRITPQLIRVADDTHLWSDRYDRTLEDVFDVQSDIARQVFDNLNVALLGNERAAIGERPTRSAEAYNAYLQALAFHRRPNYSLSNYELVVERLTEALKLDPQFALAHAALSMVHSDIYFHGYDLTQKRIDLSRASVNRALELNSDLPQAHSALGLFHYRCFLDYASAEKELRWAFEKNPNDDDIRMYLGAVRRRQGHFEDFLSLTKESLARNPRDPGLPAEIATTCMLLRRYDEAERYANLALSIQPDAEIVHLFSAMRSLHAKGDPAQARAHLRRIDLKKHCQWLRFACQIEIYAREWESALSLIQPMGEELVYEQLYVSPRSFMEGLIYLYSGRKEEARSALLDAVSRLEAGLQTHPGDARFHSSLGIAHAGLGNKDEARREAGKAVELYPTSRDHVMGPIREADLSIALALVGDVEPAIDVIEQILRRPAWFSIHQVKLEPAYDSLRSHPRYAALVAKDYPPF
jgi:tetratricopeptide (TPR) repeat protein